jgi:hypothetical protein
MIAMMGGKEAVLADSKVYSEEDGVIKLFGGIDKNRDGEIEEAELAATFEQFFLTSKLSKEGDIRKVNEALKV